MDVIGNLEKMLATGKDNATLRFGLGKAYADRGEFEAAVTHLKRAVEHDATYSAAWKLLGRALNGSGRPDAAREAYEYGIEAAERRGDIQAAKEMRVFMKRLAKARMKDGGHHTTKKRR